MKYISSILMLFIMCLINAGCESKENNSPNEEIQNSTDQQPKNNLQNQNTQPEIRPLTNLTPEQKKLRVEAFGVIKENLEATQAEDAERVLRTIHEDSPQLRSTKEGMAYVFKNFEMAYELEDMQLLSASEDEVKVLFKQTTKSLSGTGFTNTRSIGIHTLKRSKDGKLKLYSSEYLQTEHI